MQGIFTTSDGVWTGLARELAGVDARQLLDMGLVRAVDGSLRLAEDPARVVAPDPLARRWSGFWARWAGAFRALFGAPNQRPCVSRREPV